MSCGQPIRRGGTGSCRSCLPNVMCVGKPLPKWRCCSRQAAAGASESCGTADVSCVGPPTVDPLDNLRSQAQRQQIAVCGSGNACGDLPPRDTNAPPDTTRPFEHCESGGAIFSQKVPGPIYYTSGFAAVIHRSAGDRARCRSSASGVSRSEPHRECPAQEDDLFRGGTAVLDANPGGICGGRSHPYFIIQPGFQRM